MICIQLNGGLGNQMFQYACGRALAYKHQTELIIDSTQLEITNPGVTPRSFELDIFNIVFRKVSKKDIFIIEKYNKLINCILLKIGLKNNLTTIYFREKEYSYNSLIEKTEKKCYLVGYWQSYRYFEIIDFIIRSEFDFKPITDQQNYKRTIKIKNTNSVSLHVRRTDFLNNKNKDKHGTCSIDYYNKSIELIVEKFSDPFFYIFSDDIEWVQKKLNLPLPHEVVSGNNGKYSYIDMQLMSLCKHNIIANSSFSWWGAWLNKNESKIVIAPKIWFADELKNSQTDDLIPKTWIRI